MRIFPSEHQSAHAAQADVIIGPYRPYSVSKKIEREGKWGWNEHGQLGDGTRTDRDTPVKIMDHVASVSLGLMHSAAVKTDGSLWVWGSNTDGRLGLGKDYDGIVVPTPTKLGTFTAVVPEPGAGVLRQGDAPLFAEDGLAVHGLSFFAIGALG